MFTTQNNCLGVYLLVGVLIWLKITFEGYILDFLI